MPNVNVSVQSGNLGHEVEFRTMEDGLEIADISIAQNIRKAGQTVRTLWFRVRAIGRSAVWARDNLRKGDTILVKGELGYYEWVNKEGLKRNVNRIVSHVIIPIRQPWKTAEEARTSTDSNGATVTVPNTEDDDAQVF